MFKNLNHCPEIFFFSFPLNQINLFKFIFFLFFVPVFSHCKNSLKFSYVLSTKHTNHTQYMITHHSCYAYFSHNKFIKSHKTHQTHAYNVLVLSRDFLGNLIPKLNIESHLVVMFLQLKDYGLSPSPSSPR